MGNKKFDTRGRYVRHRRVRKKITSNKHIHAQIIDDEKGTTLAASSSISLEEKISKIDLATRVGEDLAQKAKTAGVKKVVFDRAGYKFHGRVKALADGARSKGLIF